MSQCSRCGGGGDSKASFVALRDMIAKDIIAAETLTAVLARASAASTMDPT